MGGKNKGPVTRKLLICGERGSLGVKTVCFFRFFCVPLSWGLCSFTVKPYSFLYCCQSLIQVGNNIVNLFNAD